MQPAPSVNNRKAGYLPSLDGWRAIAILGVLLAHDTPWTLHGGPKSQWQNYGGTGVYLFFAISGLLITTRILEEERLNGFFNIRGFYIRRFFRIQPAAFTYLGVIGLLILLQVLHDHWRFWFGGLFLYENFLWKSFADIPQSYFVGHFWTLAVEEHFYLLLSLTIFFLKRFRLSFLLAVWFVLELLARAADRGHWLIYPRRTLWCLGFLILPSAIAVALQRPRVRAWCVRWLRPWAVMLLVIAVSLFKCRHLFHDLGPRIAFSGTGQHIIDNLSHYYFALLVAATILHPQSWSTRVLEWKPLRWIGRISYSLYLWHVLFFFRDVPETHVTQPLLIALSGHPAKYIAAFAAAALSYYVIELRCMRLGHRLAPPKLAGRPELSETRAETRPGVA